MAHSDRARGAPGQQPASGVSPGVAPGLSATVSRDTVDCLVVGGGIMGLWVALKAAEAGLSVRLIEQGRIGAGASGGLLGALFPHLPERWTATKAFQFEALCSLGSEIARLEAETGQSAHYRRSGRLIPLAAPHLRVIAERLAGDAAVNWRPDLGGPDWQVLDKSPCPDWLPNEAGSHGFSHDSLAARVDPRRLTGLLHRRLGAFGSVQIREGVRLTVLDPAAGLAVTDAGTITFSHAVIASGTQAFPLVETLLPEARKPLGSAVKGQAAMLSAEAAPDWPVIYRDGLYIVPHEGGRVAIGSTSERDHDGQPTTDGQLDALIAEARALVPCLAAATVIERWAGFRPKAIGRDPLAGPVPGHDRILVAGGGFKISFGIAHRLADCLVSCVLGTGLGDLPETFLVEAHQALR